MRARFAAAGCVLWLCAGAAAREPYPWLARRGAETLAGRIPPPEGYRRVDVTAGSFAAWLRGLPLKPAGSPVLLYNGSPKRNQFVHAAVVDMDTGREDLQQCADAVIRLRAEFLLSHGRDGEIRFRFTSGRPAEWTRWKEGWRPVVSGNRVAWVARAAPDSGYGSFRRYLETVYRWAGSASLSGELVPVAAAAPMQAGDVFIQGGSPGHAVLVLDLARDAAGNTVFLLGQSYMPAQEFHILKNPSSAPSPWYHAREDGPLVTPEWVFPKGCLKRFSH